MNKSAILLATSWYQSAASKLSFRANRKWLSKGLAFVAVFSLVFSSVTPRVTIAADEPEVPTVDAVNTPAPEVTICHREENADPEPYELLTLNANGAVNGHSNHGGPIWFEGINENWGDIIPPIPSEDYPGMNWTTEGQAIWNNQCHIPEDPDNDPVPTTIQIEKEWQDSEGNPIDAPDNKSDITINVTFGEAEHAVCKYEGDDLECDETIFGQTGGATINITETGVPAGYEVDPNTVGQIVPNCPVLVDTDDKAVEKQEGDDGNNLNCTATVINKLKDAAPCNTELVANRSFEAPVVNTNDQWDIFPSGTPNLGWSATWLRSGGTGRPDVANVELHRGVSGWNSQAGLQHTELDSDFAGPSSGQSGEDASIQLFQDIPTKVGHVYNIKFWTSPRPGQGTAENITKAEMGGVELETIVENGSSNGNTVWTEHTYTFTATSTLSRLSFTDMGVGDSLGAFLDNVSVIEDCASDVTICKYDNHQTPLPGWEVYLKGDVVDTVTVPTNSGSNNLSINLPSGEYELKASGQYKYRDENEQMFSDAAYSERLAGDSVYSGPFVPWVREMDFTTIDPSLITKGTNEQGDANFYKGILGIKVDDQPYDWGSTFNPSHEYTGAYNLAVNGQIKFKVTDDHYSDNVGNLSVDISPIYKGTTGENGCVTLQNIPFDDYTLGEIMQEGWSNVSGDGSSVEVDSSEETFNLINECDLEKCAPPVITPKLHLIKVVCDEYSDVAGNDDADQYDDTGDHFTEFKNYDDGDFLVDYLVNGFVHPSEIPQDSGCSQASDWQFKLSTDQDQENDVQTVTTTGSEYVTPISGDDSDLSDALQDGIRGHNDKQFWVSEVEKEGYGFATIRCYDDVLNGDNLEYINIHEDNPTDIYCIAYNVSTIEPCVAQDPSIASGTQTDFKGLASSLPADLDDESDYPELTDGSAVAAGPTGYPGAWDGPQNDANITEGGAFWVSNSADQPTNPPGPGGDGSIDTWRLYTHTFTIPAGATSISPAILYFSADNEVTAFLDGTQVGFNNSFAVTASSPLVLTPGVHKLAFSVKNYAFQPENNPTGLIYNLDFTYCGEPTGQGETHYHATGTKWNDQNGNGVRDEGDNGIENWPIYLTKNVDSLSIASTSETGSNSVVLENGKTYIVKVTGTFDAGDNIIADAQYSERNLNPTWTDLVQNYEGYGPELLDLQIDGTSPYWGMYNGSHTYYTSLSGSGSAVNFKINDVFYPGNVGNLNVEIYELLDTTYTDEVGNYSFEVTGLEGNYSIVEGMEAGWQQSAPVGGVYTVAGNTDSDDNNFGNNHICEPLRQVSIISRLIDFVKDIVIGDDVRTCGNGISGTKTVTNSDGGPEGWVIYLDLNHNGSLDNEEPSDTTDENGNYSFGNLPTGTYYVREVGQEGWTQTTPGGNGDQVVNLGDEPETGIDFVNDFNDDQGGNNEFSISGKVYHDNNSNNGTLDPEDEDGLNVWVSYVDLNDNGSLDDGEKNDTSDADGNYTITGLAAGCYIVKEVNKSGWAQTEPSTSDEYHIGIGGVSCGGEESAMNTQKSWFSWLIPTAQAAEVVHNFPGDATGINFGNITRGGGGGGSTGGSSGGSRPGQVLGDSTDVPSTPPQGQVLGATLPVTGSPTWVLLMIVLLAAPMYYFRTLAVSHAKTK